MEARIPDLPGVRRDHGDQRPRLRHHLRRQGPRLHTGSGRLAWQIGLPAGTNTGVTVEGDMVIAPAGVAAAEGQTPQIVAYRLGG